MPLRYPSDVVVETYKIIGDLDYGQLTAEQYRNIFRAPAEQVVAELWVRTQDRLIEAEGGPLRLRFYFPEGTGPFPILLYCHGGGFMNGSPESTDSICAALAREASCIVISPDYRLAPETPFPGGLEDCWTALTWAHDHASSFGGDETRLAVCGDSSGGNFAAVLALMAASTRLKLCLQVMLYPAFDPTCDTQSFIDFATGYYPLTSDLMRWYWTLYLSGKTPDDWRVSPLRVAPIAGLAPAYIMTAEYDVLRDEAERYARHLVMGGTVVQLRRWEGHVHGFLLMHGLADDPSAAVSEAANALREAYASAAC